MASLDYVKRSQRWRVRWLAEDRARYASRTFRSESEARQLFEKLGRSQSTRDLPITDRLRRRASVNERGCWIWEGQVGNRGYGMVSAERRVRLVHRVSYEAFVGPIPKGLQIDHLCMTPLCINPAHLEPTTAQENVRRSPRTQASINAAKTHCTQGHPYDKGNARLYGPRGDWRACRKCTNERSKTSKAKGKVA